MSNISVYHSVVDNYFKGKVGDFLSECITNDSNLSFVSAYFTIYAYESLKDKLDRINSLRFLFGEPPSANTLDPEKMERMIYKITNDGIELTNVLEQKSIAKECHKWIENKVQIKSMKQNNLLHGKFYYIDSIYTKNAILGSSNFTRSGLGFAKSSNIEINLKMNDIRDSQEMIEWFNKLWESDLVEDVKKEVLDTISLIFKDNSPLFIYYKTLYHIFEKFISDDSQDKIIKQNTKITETEIWNTLYGFQKQGVAAAISKLLKYNGCIIADSVGLGKTYEALAIIKYFELLNYRVLVLTPKKLRSNWTVYQATNMDSMNPLTKDRFSYAVLNHTDLSRFSGRQGDMNLETLNWGNFDLVVIDESHNFRNATKSKKDDDGNFISISRYERLMEHIIKTGVKTKVLLLSATPVNTELKDLRNQILLFTENEDSGFKETIGIDSINNIMKQAQGVFSNWAVKRAKKEKNSTKSNLIDSLPQNFFKLLDELTIARSRKHIEKYYQDELSRIGAFPNRINKEPIYSEIDTKDRFLSYDKLSDEIDGYKLAIFNPSKYIKDDFKELYKSKYKIGNFTQEDRENYLIGMMKVNFLKRLESSVEAFEITMERTIKKIETLIEKINNFQKTKENVDVDTDDYQDISSLFSNEDDSELEEYFEVGSKLKYPLAHLNSEEWLKDLKRDREQIKPLLQSAELITPDRDAKLLKLKEIIKQKNEKPTIDNDGKENRKILVFTAFADTAIYLYESLKNWVKNDLNLNIALVTGGTDNNKSTFNPTGYNNQTKFEQILTNFAPIARKREKNSNMPQVGGIDILIATDCISEGQNLQDCDFMVNYDIHWNPVRIIQRFGRIDRIGTRNSNIYMQNFWPTNDLNKYLNLKSRVEARMVLVDITATGEDDVLNDKSTLENDQSFRDKQLTKIQNEILDLEEFDENISLSDFNLEDFRMDLIDFFGKNEELLKNTPLGLNSIVPIPNNELSSLKNIDASAKDLIQKGVIFCLRHKNPSNDLKKINFLEPYFLVYINNDGQVLYNFQNAKNTLDIMRALTQGQNQPIDKLFREFDYETNYGKNMEDISKLLVSACSSIIDKTKTKSIKELTMGRNAVMPKEKEQINDLENFELVTWLVLR